MFIAPALIAQKATIKGTVKDTKTGELLFGTNIYITGLTIGAMSDFDGNYQINIEPGTYTINCSFISYQTQKKEITVKSGESVTVNFDIGESSLQLADVKIVARKIERTESAVIAMQKKAPTVISGISSQQIKKSGDGDAASALKRLSGVTVQGGKYVYVRGLSDRYSKTTLNGAEIPGLDPERNTVQMDLFPTNILENMLVYKAFSPNLSGDFTGGLIDIKTKDFPDKFTFGFSSQIGYNPQANLNSEFLSYEGGRQDWLGIDDETRSLPTEASSDIPFRFYGKDEELNNITKSFNKTWNPIKSKSGLNQKYSVNIGDSKTLFGKELGLSFASTYSNKYKSDNSVVYGRYELTDPSGESLNSIASSEYSALGSQEIMWSTMGVAGFKINKNNRIGLTILNNHKGSKDANYMLFRNYKNTDGELRENRVLGFASRNLFVTQLKGSHYFEKLKFNWITSYAKASQDEPDARYLVNQVLIDENNDTTYSVNPSTITTPRRFYRQMNENVYYSRGDFEYPVEVMGAKTKLKFGLSDNYKTREYLQKQINFKENSQQQYQQITDMFLDTNINAVTGLRVQGSEKEDAKNSYTAMQNVFGTYIMGDIPLYEKFRVVTGLRLEYVYMLTESHKEQIGNEKNYGELDNLSFLPSLNFTYMQTTKQNWRFAYNRTLARPSFREKSPMAIESKTGDLVIGNTELQQTTIENIDFRWEKYFKPGEVLSAGAFYKYFNNPIEKTFNTKAQNPEITWRNVEKASLYGAEIEFSKKLSFVDALKNLKVSANFTYIYSQVAVDGEELAIKRYFDPNVSEYRVMSEQAPYIFNTMVSYNNDSLGLSANINYTYNAEKLMLVNPKGIPDIYQKASNELNFNITKKFGKKFSANFKITNILNDRSTQRYQYLSEEYIYSDYGWGREFSIKLSYNF